MSTNGWVGQINNTTYEWFFLSEGYKNLGVSSLLPVPVLVVKTDLVYDTESQTNVLFEVFGLGIWRSTKKLFHFETSIWVPLCGIYPDEFKNIMVKMTNSVRNYQNGKESISQRFI